ncbi:MAG: hypothetical protein OEY14_11545, partial [Myxococcales bacterium]|nr:hypothetical protein [Myxococcales bacterium]
MGELVGEEAAALLGAGLVVSVCEEEVCAEGEGSGAEAGVEIVGAGAGVDADGGEVSAEAGLHEG